MSLLHLFSNSLLSVVFVLACGTTIHLIDQKPLHGLSDPAPRSSQQNLMP